MSGQKYKKNRILQICCFFENYLYSVNILFIIDFLLFLRDIYNLNFMAINKNKLSYNDAIAEIDDILYRMENEDLDMDELSENVKRVTFLINFCREKILKTKEEVENVLKNFS